MKTKEVWKFGHKTQTIKKVEDEGPDDCTWPDRYVHENIKMLVGSIVFVTDGKEIARVECIIMRGMYFTNLVSEQEAVNELAAGML